MLDKTYWDPAHKVKADIEKTLEVARDYFLLIQRKLLVLIFFIIICEERKQKVLILNSSEKFIMVLANTGHVLFNVVSSKHRYCRCLLIKIFRPHRIVFTFHENQLSDETTTTNNLCKCIPEHD